VFLQLQPHAVKKMRKLALDDDNMPKRSVRIFFIFFEFSVNVLQLAQTPIYEAFGSTLHRYCVG
jgi:hypothetical protein